VKHQQHTDNDLAWAALLAVAVAMVALVVLFSGCASTTNTGAKWYAPATWFSHRPADTVDAANAKEDRARIAVIKSAQRATHETALALASAPPSRPVEVATSTNADAVVLLDQAAGPLTAAEAAQLRATVAGLLSDNSKLREAAEATRLKEQRSVAEVSAALATAESKSEAAEARLRAAFDRENALANELRGQRALVWIAGGVAVLLAAGWLYAQIALGGIPAAAGRALGQLRATNPAAAEAITPLLDTYLNRHEQARIRKAAHL
jgi:hypothetical protein